MALDLDRLPARCCTTCADERTKEQKRRTAYSKYAFIIARPCEFCGTLTCGLLLRT